MIAALPTERLVQGAVLVGGLALGLVAAAKPAFAPVLLGGFVFVAAAVRYPGGLVALMFVGMLLDKAGLTGIKLEDFPVTLSKLSVALGVAAWTAHVLYVGVKPGRWHPVLSALLGMMAATGVSIAAANAMNDGKFIFYGMGMMTVLVALVYAVLADRDFAWLYRFVTGVLLLAMVSALLAPAAAGEAGRATGTMGDPNEWATMVLLLAGFLLGGLAGDESAWGRSLRFLLLLLAPLTILRSESRASLLVLVLVFPGWLWLLRGARLELGLTGIGMLIGVPAVLTVGKGLERLENLVARLSGGGLEEASLSEREELLAQGLDLFERHLLLGAGPGRFGEATGYVSDLGKFRPAHNTYLEIAAEQGLLGVSALAVFAGVVLWTLRRGYRATREAGHQNRVVGVALGLAAVALMAATLGLLTFAMAYLVLGVGLAVVWQAEQAGRRAGLRRKR